MCRRPNFPILFGLALVLWLLGSAVVRAEFPKPVSLWKFDGDTKDSGTGGNNGVLKGTAAIATDPQRGKCLELDGEGYVDIASGVAELGSADFTIAAWVKTPEIGIPILSKSNGNGQWEAMEKELYVADSEMSDYENDGTVEYVGHSCDWVRGGTCVDDGGWHHVVLTWDADAEDGLVYVDGLEATDDVGFDGGPDNAGDTIRIGFSESEHSSGNFVGRIDDVAIFNVALSGAQVAELTEATREKVPKEKKVTIAAVDYSGPVTLDTDPNLAGWWKFDETSGEVAADSSRYGRKGTLRGGLSFDGASADGRIGKALKLDGEDDHIAVIKYKGITGTRPRTVAAWIRTKDSGGQITAWGARDFGRMWIFGFIRGRVGVTPSGGYLYMNDAVDDDKWHHVASVVHEAELPNLHDDVKLYLDGEPATIHDIGLLDLWPVDTGGDLDVTIGRRFKGMLDDVRIYDRPLSEEEVKLLFDLKSNRPLRKTK